MCKRNILVIRDKSSIVLTLNIFKQRDARSKMLRADLKESWKSHLQRSKGKCHVYGTLPNH